MTTTTTTKTVSTHLKARRDPTPLEQAQSAHAVALEALERAKSCSTADLPEGEALSVEAAVSRIEDAQRVVARAGLAVERAARRETPEVIRAREAAIEAVELEAQIFRDDVKRFYETNVPRLVEQTRALRDASAAAHEGLRSLAWRQYALSESAKGIGVHPDIGNEIHPEALQHNINRQLIGGGFQ